MVAIEVALRSSLGVVIGKIRTSKGLRKCLAISLEGLNLVVQECEEKSLEQDCPEPYEGEEPP